MIALLVLVIKCLGICSGIWKRMLNVDILAGLVGHRKLMYNTYKTFEMQTLDLVQLFYRPNL